MSSVDRSLEKRMYKEIKVNKELLKAKPAIVDHFWDWYLNYAKDSTELPKGNDFFYITFKYQIAVWWDYFNDCGIDIVIGDDKVYVFYNDRESSPYKLSNKREIFYIESDATPSDRFEEAVAELICRIQQPF